MSIDLEQEAVMSLREAANSVPTIDGKKVHLSTIWRWARKGLNGVYLEHVRIGRRVCTSRQAISRFVNALAEKDAESISHTTSPCPPNNAQTPKVRQAQIHEANRSLDDLGL